MLHTGKRPATPSPLDFNIHELADVEKAAAAPFHWHDTGFALQMYANGPDPTAPAGATGGVGDCVIAMMSNAIQFWRHASGRPLAPLNGATAVRAYSAITGYVVGNAATDQGTDMGEAASFWRHTGLEDLAGERHVIDAYATFDPTNLTELTAVIKLFGVAGIGINFPSRAMEEFNDHKTWSYHANDPTEGGHAILAPRPERLYTWAAEVKDTGAFIRHQADEGFAFVSKEFLNALGETPEGFNEAALDAKLAAL
jgi:hypothetical protein